MADPRIKRITQPVFKDSEMTALNPILKKGEVVWIRDEVENKVINFKVGNGASAYSSLEFKDGSTYPYTEAATVSIGDITVNSTHKDRLIADMMKDIISPYQAPQVSNVQNNADGTYKNTAVKEIGQSIGSSISLLFNVSNASNLVATPIELDSSGDFLEANPYANGSIALTPNGTLSPTSPKTYSIGVRAIHNQGVSSYAYTYIRFDTRAFWGASSLADLTTQSQCLAVINNGGGQELVQNYSGKTFEITASGYHYVFIPSMIGITPVWTEVSNPNTPSTVGMIKVRTISINNGIGTYNYDAWRTPYFNNSGSKLKAE